MRSNRESDRSDSQSSQTAQTESRTHHWYVAYPARMPITPLLLAIPLLLPSDMGRWISTENDLGGVCAVVALPDGRVATLDGDSGHVRLGSGESATTLDLSRTLHQPRGLSHCEDGRIFVADTGNHRVMFFDGEGLMLGGFGGRGSEDYRLLAPHDVAVGSNFVAVADTGNDRVQLYQLGGKYLYAIEGSPDDPMRRPEGIAIDSDNRIWVADTHNHRVLCFSPSGKQIRSIGSWGNFPGQFMEPSGIDTADGYIVVTDRLNHRVQILDGATGAAIESWGMHSFLPRQGEGRVHYPADAAILPQGDIVVAEPFEERTQRFGASGKAIDKPAQAPPGVQSHFGPVAATDGRFFCTWEPELRAIHIFDLDRRTPVRLSTFGTPGTAPGQLGDLTAMAIDADRQRLWAVDATNARVHEWMLNPPPPDQPRFDPSMATLNRSAPLQQSGPGDLVKAGSDLVFLDRNQARGWTLQGDGQHSPIAIDLLRDPIAALAVPGEDGQNPRFAVLDARERAIQLHGVWPGHSSEQRSIELVALEDPVDLAQLSDNSIVVVDRAAHRIHRFAVDGTELASWGERGVEHGQLWRPAAVVVDHHDRIIVLDHGNHRAQMFEPDGTWIMTFGAGRAWTADQESRAAASSNKTTGSEDK